MVHNILHERELLDMSHLRYFGLKSAMASMGHVSWFRRIDLGRLWNELLYHVQKESGARCGCRTVMVVSI